MRYVPTVNDNSLRGGLKASAALHLAMFSFMFFGLPHLMPPLPSHHQPVPFDIVTIADITNTRIDDNPQQDNQPPAAQQKPQPPQPTPPQPVPQEKPQPAPPPKVESKAEDIGEALKPKPLEKPKPPAPEKPAQAQQQPQQDMLASVLKNVAKMKPAEAPANPNAMPNPDAKATTGGANVGPALSSRLTITEEDLLRRQIEQCWNPPVGARNAESLVVEVVIDVNPDRTVLNAEVVDKMRYATDSFYRAAADAALRALRNPKCNPLELAPDKYEQWKRINFTFDPRDML